MNKTEQGTHFSEKTIKFRPPIVYIQYEREISVIIEIEDYLCYKEPKSSYTFFSYFNIMLYLWTKRDVLENKCK